MSTLFSSQPDPMLIQQKLIWGAIAFLALVPFVAVGFSPQLAWRDAIYIASGFAGVAGLSALLVQPLLAGRYKALGLKPMKANQLHRFVGLFLLLAVLAHVIGLYVTSPLDVIDVFLLRAPTIFSFWGLLAFYALLVCSAVSLSYDFRWFCAKVGP
ncbi:MAG: ferric reductase-like transmembrane domain-containing protein [Litoreibacter sp.]|nr:ferric reductase-like transmembrane domain-containing protein [Litoreibacter sp.]